MDKLWIYGTGGHSAVVSDLIMSMNCYKIIGYIDDDSKKNGQQLFNNVMVYSQKEFIVENEKVKIKNIIYAIGDNSTRIRLNRIFPDYNSPIIIHPTAIIGKYAVIDSGTVIMPYAIIETLANVGKHCIINNNAIIGHGVIVDDFCHIGGRAVLSGEVKVGYGSLVGVGATITPRVVIGKNCVVGAGSAVSHNVEDSSFVIGNPARKLSNYLVK